MDWQIEEFGVKGGYLFPTHEQLIKIPEDGVFRKHISYAAFLEKFQKLCTRHCDGRTSTFPIFGGVKKILPEEKNDCFRSQEHEKARKLGGSSRLKEALTPPPD